MQRKIPIALALGMLCAMPALPAAEPQLVPTPRARALSISPTNRPFLGATHVEQPVALAPQGYAESEHVVSGFANVYEWSGTPVSGDVSVRDADIPYATRILVRRPTDPRRFSGMVVVELLNPTGLYDFAPLWGFSAQHFLRRGDVWVGVTVKPVAAATLRRFDPVRYAPLDFSFRQDPACTPATAPGAPGADEGRVVDSPDTENGLAWDIIAQVGALLRSSSKENPLLDLPPRQMVVAGYSQTGGYVTTYANAMHRMQRRGDGEPVYDGYMNAAGSSSTPINQCAPALADDDPRRGVLSRGVPFVRVMTESDFNRVPALRREDSDAPRDFFRLYEIPGSGHAGPFAAGVPNAADLRIAGFATPADDMCLEPRGDFPVGLAFNAVWQQYAAWLAEGTPMASMPRIATDAAHQPELDGHGNAIGGWRLPQLDLPLARYAGRSTPREDTPRAQRGCALTGAMQPFEAGTLRSLYRDRNEYARLFRQAVELAVQERRLVKEDGDALISGVPRSLPQF